MTTQDCYAGVCPPPYPTEGPEASSERSPGFFIPDSCLLFPLEGGDVHAF